MFPQLARQHDRARYRMYFGTLNPIWPDLRQYLDEQNVTWFDCGATSRAGYPGALIKLASYLRSQRIELLHAHLFEPSVIGLLAARLAGISHTVMTRHYSDYHTRINKYWHVKLDQMCTRLSDRVIAVSRHTADHMTDAEAAPRSKLRAIHNGIDFSRIRMSSQSSITDIRREFSAEGDFLVLIVARLHPEKGYDDLFQAIAKIKERTSRGLQLLIAGRGTFEDAFKARVRGLGIEDNVRFLGFRRDVPDLMSAADIVVLPSVAEAFGLVLTEALYLGTPVVATRVGGIPEIIDDGVDGILVPPANPEALGGAILNLLEDEDLRKSMGGRGRDKVIDKFQFNTMVRAYEGVYEELLKGSTKETYAAGLGHHPNV